MTFAEQIERALRDAGLDIVGVSIGRKYNKASWIVDFKKPPSTKESAAAAKIITAFDIAAAMKKLPLE